LKKNARLGELKIGLNIILITQIIIIIFILYFRTFLLLLFGIEEEEKDVISLLYMFLQTVRGPLTRHSGARSSPPEQPGSRSNIT